MIKYIKIVALSFLWVCIGVATDYQIPSFKEWKDRCDTNIPHFKDAFKASGKLHDFSKTATNYTEFMQAVTEFTALNRNLLTAGKWLDNEIICFGQQANNFAPHIQALRVKPGTEIIMFGDRHGDARSTLSMIEELSYKGYFDPKNQFKLKPGVMLIGLGDYVDRGNAGVETLLTVLWLKINNPEQVILVRGNHEDCNYHINVAQFQDEVRQKLGHKVTSEDIKKINSLYDLMPVAVFIGSGNSKETHFMIGCHGFIEPGYYPGQLLDMVMEQPENTSCFEMIKDLKRGFHLKNLSPELMKKICILCKESPQFAKELNSFACINPRSPSQLGWLWSYTIVDDGQTALEFDETSRTWQWGKQMTQEMLAYWSKPDAYTVSWIFRGHQHSHNQEYTLYPKIMHRLWENDGLYKLWSAQKDAHSLACPGAFTLSVAPDNVYAGVVDQDIYPGCNYDTWVVLKTALTPDQWKLTVHNKAMFELAQTPIVIEGKKIVPQKSYTIPVAKNADNFYPIQKGKCYRTKLLPPAILEQYVKEHNIKAILNLRQADPESQWYKDEVALCDKYGIKLHDVGFHPTTLPSKEQLAHVLELFNCPKAQPLLMHCYAGADRTGLIAALWVAQKTDGGLKDALAQQSPFFNHNAYAFPHLIMFTHWWYYMKYLHNNDTEKILSAYDPKAIMKHVTLPKFQESFLTGRV